MVSTSAHSALLEQVTQLARTIRSSAEPTNPSVPSSSSALPKIPEDVLLGHIQKIWDGSEVNPAIGGDGNGASGSEPSARRIEILRSTLDLIGREMVVSPIIHGQPPEMNEIEADEEAFQTALQDRLDIVLTLYEVVYTQYPSVPSLEPGSLFINLLEELVELISVESWRDLWPYLTSRSKRFTKDMPASRGKALPLLRIINAFLRFLPRTPADLSFRGEVHQFASSVIGVADKSAINMRGDYNEIKTTWEEEDEEEAVIAEAAEEGDGDGDIKMESAESKADAEPKTSTSTSTSEPDFYSTLWSLQQYFAHPPSLDGPPDEQARTPFEQFKIKSDFVLPKLFEQTQKEKDLMGKESELSNGKKRKRDGEEPLRFPYPRYLTGKRLLEHELADPSFRRQILVQYFILFQFLLNLTPSTAGKQAFTGGMPKTFVINPDDEAWIKGKVSSIREELRKMVPDGTRFEDTVLSIITRERHYAQWKNDGCPEGIFEVPSLDTSSAEEHAQLWNLRLAPPRPFFAPLGTRSLSRMWKGGFTSIDQLKGWKRQHTVESLYEELKPIDADEEDDRAMGIDIPAEKLAENAEKRTKLTWRAVRLAAQGKDVRHLASLAEKRDLGALMGSLKGGPGTQMASGSGSALSQGVKAEASGMLSKAGSEAGEGSGTPLGASAAQEDGGNLDAPAVQEEGGDIKVEETEVSQPEENEPIAEEALATDEVEMANTEIQADETPAQEELSGDAETQETEKSTPAEKVTMDKAEEGVV